VVGCRARHGGAGTAAVSRAGTSRPVRAAGYPHQAPADPGRQAQVPGCATGPEVAVRCPPPAWRQVGNPEPGPAMYLLWTRTRTLSRGRERALDRVSGANLPLRCKANQSPHCGSYSMLRTWAVSSRAGAYGLTPLIKSPLLRGTFLKT